MTRSTEPICSINGKVIESIFINLSLKNAQSSSSPYYVTLAITHRWLIGRAIPRTGYDWGMLTLIHGFDARPLNFFILFLLEDHYTTIVLVNWLLELCLSAGVHYEESR